MLVNAGLARLEKDMLSAGVDPAEVERTMAPMRKLAVAAEKE